MRRGRPAAILGHYLSAGDGRRGRSMSAPPRLDGVLPGLLRRTPSPTRAGTGKAVVMARPLERLLAPPQQVMDRARAAQQTTLLDEIQADLRTARADWLHACDHLAGRDDERNRRSVAEAMDELDGLLDTFLETREA